MPTGRPSRFTAPLLAAVQRAPTSLILYGTDRPGLTRASLGLAVRLDPESIWFDIRERSSEPAAWQQALTLEFPRRRHRAIYVDQMKLDTEAIPPVTSAFDPQDPAYEETLTIADLMKITADLREVALDGERPEGPRVIVITNADRASAAFSGREGALRPYIDALNRFGITVVVTSCGEPRSNVHDADPVLRLAPDPSGDAERDALVCMAVRNPGLFPSVPPGAQYSVASIELRDRPPE